MLKQSLLLLFLSIFLLSCESKKDPLNIYTEFDKSKIQGVWITIKKEKYIDTKVIDATDKNTYAYSQITSFITDTTYLGGIKEPESDTVIIVCDTLKYRLNKDTLYFENPFLVRTFGDTLAIIPKKKSDTTVLFKLLRLNKLPRYDSLHFEYRFPH